MRGWLFVSCALLAACATGPQRVEEARLRAMGTRSYSAPFDDVMAATVLTLERRGYLVTQANRQTGSVQATLNSGRGYSVDLTQDGAEVKVMAEPIPWQPTWQLSGPTGERARWDDLEKGTRELLSAWREHPEWKLDVDKNVVSTVRFTANLPRDWAHLEPAVDRRSVVVQRRAPDGQGLDPTFVFQVMPRRLMHPLKASLEEAAGLAFDAPGRVVAPDQLIPRFGRPGSWGTTRVLVNGQEEEVTFKRWDARTPEWTVLVTAVCGKLESIDNCEREWMELVDTVDDRGFDHPRPQALPR